MIATLEPIARSVVAVGAQDSPFNTEGVRQEALNIIGIGLAVVAIIMLFSIRRYSVGDAVGKLAVVVIALLIAGLSVSIITGASETLTDWILN